MNFSDITLICKFCDRRATNTIVLRFNITSDSWMIKKDLVEVEANYHVCDEHEATLKVGTLRGISLSSPEIDFLY